LNALENAFGKSIYDNTSYVPTDVDMNKAFDVLNKSLFNNQLPKIDVQCLTTS